MTRICHIIKVILLHQQLHCFYFIPTATTKNSHTPSENSRGTIYVIKVNGGEYKAKLIATELQLQFLGKLGSLEDLYFVEETPPPPTKKKRWKKSKVDNISLLLESHRSISFVQEQKVGNRRVKRGYFQDSLYPRQWYLENQGFSSCKFDLNVVSVWRSNITGKNITVSVLDDGLEHTHPDLRRNYDSKASYDYNDHDTDPTPRDTADNSNAHGTKCAGEIAAEAGNALCGVGVAYDANIGGIRMIDGPSYDSTEAASLSYNWHHIDIYSNSWGPPDDGKTIDGPGPLTVKAIQDGAKTGRNGLGSIYVWATGNGGQQGDYCSCDGFINMPETIAINAVDHCGNIPYYAESCPGVLATAYSSGKMYSQTWKISTTDLRGECTSEHSGTSAAAPLAAGVFALVLEANRNITWRDLQYLIIKSSKVVNPNHLSWNRNGAGHLFSIYYGYGVLDASAMVTMASDPKWQTVSERHTCMSIENNVRQSLHSKEYFQKIYYTDGCNSLNSSCVQKLEHVVLFISMTSRPRGGLRIVLKSPSGTSSQMLQPRRKDTSNRDINEWKFLSVAFWGENPTGFWTMSILQTQYSAQTGYLNKWKVILYGTCDRNSIMTVKDTGANDLTYYTGAGIAGVCVISIVVTLTYVWLRRSKDASYVVSFSNEAYDHNSNLGGQ